jgi:hydrogenase 3 maturation protease
MTWVVLCIGNRDNGDDGIGPWIAEHAQASPDTVFIDAGTVPENYTSPVRRHAPSHMVLVDAADMGLPAGSIRRIPSSLLGTMHISTHGLSLSLLIDYLAPHIPTITLLGIQPSRMEGRLSADVATAGRKALSALARHDLEAFPILTKRVD